MSDQFTDPSDQSEHRSDFWSDQSRKFGLSLNKTEHKTKKIRTVSFLLIFFKVVDKKGRFIVTDNNHQVYIFDKDGELITKWKKGFMNIFFENGKNKNKQPM